SPPPASTANAAGRSAPSVAAPPYLITTIRPRHKLRWLSPVSTAPTFRWSGGLGSVAVVIIVASSSAIQLLHSGDRRRGSSGRQNRGAPHKGDVKASVFLLP